MNDAVSKNAMFESVFQSIPEPCAVIAADPPAFTFVAVNEAYEASVGRRSDEIVGRAVTDVFPVDPEGPSADSLCELLDSFERVITEGVADSIGAYRYDIECVDSPDDRLSERWWSPRNFPLFDQTGSVSAILHRVEEVTEAVILGRIGDDRSFRGGSEEESAAARILVVESNESWRLYLEQICSLQGEVRSTGDARRAREIVAEFSPELVLVGIYSSEPESVELIEHLCSELQGKGPRVIASSRSGSLESRELAMRCGADDVVFEGGSAREILARVDAQLAAAALEQDIAQRWRRQLQELFMNAPAFIAIMEGREHIYTLNNPAHQRLLKHRPVLGKTVRDVFEHDNVAEAVERLDQVYETGVPFFAEEAPVPLFDPDTGEQHEHYLTFVYLPTHDIDGEIDGVAAFGWDVTELVEARQLVEQQAGKLREESRLKDEFLAMLGHELRNPLAPLATVADMLKMQPTELSDEKLEWVRDVIDRQVTQLSALVDDLLDVARISQGRIDMDCRPWDLAEVIDASVETVEPLVDQNGQSLLVCLPDEQVTIDVDRTRIVQVISNLLHNATKYAEAGGQIKLDVWVDADELMIAVQDDGEGIAPDVLPHIFELFRQADPAIDRAHGGLGLGLTLVRRLSEMHGGRVYAHSDGIGTGAHFEVCLPVVAEVKPAERVRN